MSLNDTKWYKGCLQLNYITVMIFELHPAEFERRVFARQPRSNEDAFWEV